MNKSVFAWWLQQLEPGTNFLNGDFIKKEVRDSRPIILKHGERRFDVTDFLYKHPGGSKVLRQFSDKDVQKQMCSPPHEHSAMAYSLLGDYQLGSEKQSETMNVKDGFFREKEEIESGIDWSKGMVRQVGSLGPRYERWLEFPVDRKLHLFDSPLLENLTRSYWYLVPVIWCPVIALFLKLAALSLGKPLGVWVLPGFLTGLVSWSLLEYVLHRFLFHMPVPRSNPTLITIHFLIHGLHHKVPFDRQRLVFPPLGTLIISIPILSFLFGLLPPGLASLLMAGLYAGYVFYDLCHYYLHHGDPSPNSFFYQLKRYHAQHHFLHHNQGFGITSKFWDTYFGTDIQMKKY